MNQTNAIGSNWKDVRKELFTQDEIRKSDERVSEISKKLEGKKSRTAREKRINLTMASPKKADAIFHYMKTSENIFENILILCYNSNIIYFGGVVCLIYLRYYQVY